MKPILFLSGCAALAVILGAGCKSLSLSDESDSNRILIGAADFTPPQSDIPGQTGSLPANASMQIRVVDQDPQADTASNPAMNSGLYNGQTSGSVRASSLGPQILGEATVPDASALVDYDPIGHSWQIPFKVYYSATDDQLRRGLNLEVRISYDGGVRYSNYNQYSLSLSDAKDKHIVRVERMR
jgi:hypothetical protein